MMIAIPPLPPLAERALGFALGRFRLDVDHCHGAAHWVRVWAMGAHIARNNGADLELVALFAVLHDVAREVECSDCEHGPAAVRLLRCSLRGWRRRDPARFDLLCEAISGHSDGWLADEPTIAACWDADRLDLWRVGREPEPALLSTPIARELIAAARQLEEADAVFAAAASWLDQAGY